MTAPILAYQHPALPRDAFLAEVAAHQAADHYIPCEYWDHEAGRGCAIGCAIEIIIKRTGYDLAHSDHAALATYLGIPCELAKLQDVLFENLPRGLALKWPLRFAQAIPDRGDLSRVWPTFAAWMLREIVIPTLGKGDAAQAALTERIAAGMETDWAQDDRAAARDAVWGAARAAAWDAAWDAAQDAAWDAAQDAARAAAQDAAWDAAWDAAQAAAYVRMADKLVALLAAAPVVAGDVA